MIFRCRRCTGRRRTKDRGRTEVGTRRGDANEQQRQPVEPVRRPRIVAERARADHLWVGQPEILPAPPAPRLRYFDVDRDARVVAHCHWQPRPWEHARLLALHGLNGSSEAHYMRGIAAKAFAQGMNAVRLNQRNCGDTEHLSAGLFHSGLTADVRHVVEELIAVDGCRRSESPAIRLAAIWR